MYLPTTRGNEIIQVNHTHLQDYFMKNLINAADKEFPTLWSYCILVDAILGDFQR